MREAEELSSLIEAVYDCALEPGLWPIALRRMTLFVGGWASGIYLKDAANRSGVMHYHDGIITEANNARYFDGYVRVDPFTIRHYFLEVGQAASATDLLPYDEYLESRFYREWVEPQGLIDHLAAVLDKDQTSVSIFGVFRSHKQGLVDDTMRRRMGLLVPHVRRAMMIGGLLERREIAASAFAQALDAVSAAVFLVDASGAIRHANTAALAMLANDGPVRDVNGHLAGIEQELRAALAPDAATPSYEPITGRDGAPYLVHVLPLQGQYRGTAGDAVAAVFVQPTTLTAPAAPEAIAKAYNLTPTELRTMLAAVDIGSVAQVADALGISATTVKFHLRGIYAKTGSTRQADLVKLVAGFSGP